MARAFPHDPTPHSALAGTDDQAPRSITFAGTVRLGSGEPAAGARVYVRLSEQSEVERGTGPQGMLRQVQAEADGSFRLEVPLSAERWGAEVAAITAGSGPGGRYVHSEQEAADLELRLWPSGSIAGRVVGSDGEPITGAVVRVRGAHVPNGQPVCLLPEEVNPPPVTDAEGRFLIEPIPAHSRVSVEAEHPAYARMPGAVEFRSRAGGVLITLLPAGSIIGRVVDEGGAPAAGLRVRCEGGMIRIPPATSDAEGRFRFDQLPSDSYVLSLKGSDIAPELWPDPQVCAAAEATETNCPDLRLARQPVGCVVGRVTDADSGQPIERVGIAAMSAFRAPDYRMIRIEGPSVLSDVEGRYRLPLRPGTYQLRIDPWQAGFVAPADFFRSSPLWQIAAGQTITVDYALPRAVGLQGRVLDSDGQPAAGARVCRSQHELARADDAGCFELKPGFPPDELMPLQFISRDRSQMALVEVTPGQVSGELLVRLEPLATVTGEILDGVGVPVADAWIMADRRPDGPHGKGLFISDPLASALSDAAGHFSLSLPPETECRIRVDADGFSIADHSRIRVSRGEKQEPLRFTLQREDRFISGIVVDAEGRPLAGAQVGAKRLLPGRVMAGVARAMSDPQGRFQLGPLVTGEVRLQAHRSGYYPDHRRSVAAGATGVRLMLAPIEAEPSPPPAAGSPAPEIEVSRWVNGTGPDRLSTLRGKTLLLQFSSAYNPAARPENAALKALASQFKAAGRSDVVMLALYDNSAPAAEVEAYAQSEGLPFPIGLVDPGHGAGLGLDSPTFLAYGVRRLPALFLIDQDGKLRAVDPTREELVKFTAVTEGP